MIDQSQQTAVTIQPPQSSLIPDRQLRTRSTAPGLDSKSTTLPKEGPSSSAKSQRQATSFSPAFQRGQSVSVAASDSTENPAMETYQVLAPGRTKTGRISKALKGCKVHTCRQCGKIYSRAEHLRRHQNNHQGDPLVCKVCDKVFYREDLLTRHHHSKHVGYEADISLGSTDVEVESSARSDSRVSATPMQMPDSPIPLSASVTVKSEPLSNTHPSYLISPESSLATTGSYSKAPVKTAFPTWTTDSALQFPTPAQPWIPYQIPQPGNFLGPEPYPPFSAVDWSGIHAGLSPSSTSPPALDQIWIESEMASIKTSSSSSPPPVSAVPPVLLPLSVVNPEDSVEDSQLGIKLSMTRKKAYFDAYWRHFHPLFPILHKQTFSNYMRRTGGRGLLAAIMAIGAQYSDEQLAGSDSRILHERCEEYVLNQRASPCNNLETMQLIVLVEYLSHFKSKRAPDNLSDVFITVYDQLWQRHFQHHSRSALDSRAEIPYQASEETIQRLWDEWIELHSLERLLSACYILDSRHALLFGRRNHAADTMSSLELFIPASSMIWDAQTATKWAQVLRTKRTPTETINQLLDKIDGTNDVACDLFQSALVIACYATDTMIQLHNSPGFACAAHPMFESSHREVLAKALAQHESVQIMHRVVQLVSFIPFKALIATAGESWFFSRKLAGDANTAAEEFKRLKLELHHWSTGSIDTTGFIPTASTNFYNAISVALQIIQSAVSAQSPHITLSFGPELALYIATIVLWAAAFSGLKHARTTGRGSISTDVDPAEWEALRAENLIKGFLPLAKNDVTEALSNATSVQPQQQQPQQQQRHPQSPSRNPSSNLTDLAAAVSMPIAEVFPLVETASAYGGAATTLAFPPAKDLDSWITGVGSVIRWTAFVLGGSGRRQSGAGEMIEGTIGVLEKLGRSGWIRSWF